MSDGRGVLSRLRTKLTPQFLEDWTGAAGTKWRAGIARFKDYNEKHIRAAEKVDAAPDLAWRKIEGAASVEHAQAEKAYAEAENIRMEAELKRRMADSTVAKAKADVELAQIAVLTARLELFKRLKDAGVGLTADPLSPLGLVAIPAPDSPRLSIEDVLEGNDTKLIAGRLVSITPSISAGQKIIQVSSIEWFISVGDRVYSKNHIGSVSLGSSPNVRLRIPAPITGVVASLLTITEPRPMRDDDAIGTILPD